MNINAITTWATTLKLTLNVMHSNILSRAIKKTETVRDFGLYINDKLTFKTHINNTYLKMARMLGAGTTTC